MNIPPISFPHTVYDAGGMPLRIEKILAGVKCSSCAFDADLGVLVFTGNSYTLICPRCGETSSRPATEIDEAIAKADERKRLMEAAAADDRAQAQAIAARAPAKKKKPARKVSKVKRRTRGR